MVPLANPETVVDTLLDAVLPPEDAVVPDAPPPPPQEEKATAATSSVATSRSLFFLFVNMMPAGNIIPKGSSPIPSPAKAELAWACAWEFVTVARDPLLRSEFWEYQSLYPAGLPWPGFVHANVTVVDVTCPLEGETSSGAAELLVAPVPVVDPLVEPVVEPLAPPLEDDAGMPLRVCQMPPFEAQVTLFPSSDCILLSIGHGHNGVEVNVPFTYS